MYFTQVHEDAIIAYTKSTDRKEKEKLYRELIGPTFNEMVTKIVYTYKFNLLPNIEDLKDECKVWITTILDKFDPSKGSKAFSYFSVITKNWFIHKVKKNTRQAQKEVFLDDAEKNNELNFESLQVKDEYESNREMAEFWRHLFLEIDMWENADLKENELKVLKAIRILLEEPDGIDIYNKKACYLYIRHITNLNTKQVVNNLNRIRLKYKEFKTDWDNGEI